MHTIVILSDTLKHDDEIVVNIKKLFPDCTVQIFSKTVEASKNRHMHSNKTHSFPNEAHRFD